jgi:uncharacterized membrane protein YhaH (DUF805 family)
LTAITDTNDNESSDNDLPPYFDNYNCKHLNLGGMKQMSYENNNLGQTQPSDDESAASSGLPKFQASAAANRTVEVPSIALIAAYLRMWKLYTNFRTRSTRGEYWKAYLGNAVVGIIFLIALILLHNLVFVVIYFLYSLALIVPSLAITIRRLHDTDHSGGWFFIGFVPLVGAIILLVFTLQRSTPGENRYGPPVTSLP